MSKIKNNEIDQAAVTVFKDLLWNNNNKNYIKYRKNITEYILFKFPYNTVYDCIYISRNYNKCNIVTGIETEFVFGCYYNHNENFVTNVTYELERYFAEYNYNFSENFNEDTGIAINNNRQSELKQKMIKYAEHLLEKHVKDHVYTELLLDEIDKERKTGYEKWAKNAFLKDTKLPETYVNEAFYSCSIGDAMDYDEQHEKWLKKRIQLTFLAKPKYENTLDYVEKSYLNKCIIDLKKKSLNDIVNNPIKHKELHDLKRMINSITNQKTVKIHAKIIVNNISFDFINRVNAVRIKNFDADACLHCWELEPTTSRQVKEVAKCSYFCVSPEEISEIYYNGKTLYSKEEK